MKTYAVCQECDSLEIDAIRLLCSGIMIVGEWRADLVADEYAWCCLVPSTVKANVSWTIITEEELKVRQVEKRLKGVSV